MINCDYYQIQSKKKERKIDTEKTKEAENSHIMSVRRIDPGLYGLACGFIRIAKNFYFKRRERERESISFIDTHVCIQFIH